MKSSTDAEVGFVLFSATFTPCNLTPKLSCPKRQAQLHLVRSGVLPQQKGRLGRLCCSTQEQSLLPDLFGCRSCRYTSQHNAEPMVTWIAKPTTSRSGIVTTCSMPETKRSSILMHSTKALSQKCNGRSSSPETIAAAISDSHSGHVQKTKISM